MVLIYRVLQGDKVSICVGPEKATWELPIALLINHSPYFHKALSGDWKEKEQARIDLSDQDVTTFKLALQYLLQGKIDGLEISSKEDPFTWTTIRTHVRLYALAEYLQIPKLGNLALDEIVKGLSAEKDVAGYLGSAETRFIIENMLPDAPLYRFAVKLCAFVIFAKNYDAADYDICFEQSSDFAVGVMNALRKARRSDLLLDPRQDKTELYHRRLEIDIVEEVG
ncbi:MAG: hypothetical protein M1835_001672 [Candelina submexicana]|nr:MAG: hypothetical protein M1835_001672 [Candelina submexicana]